jgi:uncharacterized protein YbjT (DUF2867 family)
MYVITGASGNTGKLIVHTLLEAGKKVRVIGRNLERLKGFTEKGAEPFIADVTNRIALAQAFDGAHAVYLMLPPNPASPDYRAEQNKMIAAMAHAVNTANVPYAVTLSSVGADKPTGTGPVVGLYELEQTLNRIPGLNTLHLRAGYFMENLLAQVHVVSAMNSTAGMFHPDLPIAMIATRDIGTTAAEALLRLDFNGQRTHEILGQRDLSMNQATAIMGQALGWPHLNYTPVAGEEFKTALTHLGVSSHMADLIEEMCNAMNSGHMQHLEQRSAANTTPTSFETFVAEEFVPAWNAATRPNPPDAEKAQAE